MLLSLPKINIYLQWQERNNLDELIGLICKKHLTPTEDMDDEGSSKEDFKTELFNCEKQVFINGIYTNTFQDITNRNSSEYHKFYVEQLQNQI